MCNLTVGPSTAITNEPKAIRKLIEKLGEAGATVY